MKNTENVSAPAALRNEQPEEFDLVILGGGTGLPYTALRDAVLTHPTLVEGLFIQGAKLAVDGGRTAI